MLDWIGRILPNTAGGQQEVCSIQPACFSLSLACTDIYQVVLYRLSLMHMHPMHTDTWSYKPWDPSICFLSFPNRCHSLGALIQKQAGLAFSFRWGRGSLACHGQLTKGGKGRNRCMQMTSSLHFVTYISQQMLQVIMQMRVVLLGALIKYNLSCCFQPMSSNV